MKPTMSLLFLVSLLLGGCKKEPLPDHVVQQQRRDRKLAKRQKELKQASAVRTDAGVDSYRLWPKPVQEAFYGLFRARSEGLPKKAQALARFGLPAVEALRTLAAQTIHSPKKVALVSFMLVDLHMFRVSELAKMAREYKLPFVQRAAIESLARVGNPQSEAELDKLVKDLAKMPVPEVPQGGAHDHDHGSGPLVPDHTVKETVIDVPPDRHPMVLWARQVRKAMTGKRWAYSEVQLATLDRILQADSPEKLRIAINAVQDDTLEAGLRAILFTPVAKESIKAGVAFKRVDLRSDKPARLLQLCGPEEEDQMVRMLAIRQMLRSRRPRDRAQIQKLAKNLKDPLAPMITKMLSQPPPK